jgi:uncharacterized membrane protein
MSLTEEQIESRVERMTDNIDRRFMSGQLTQDNYNKEMAELQRWADRQFDLRRRA